MIILLSPWIKFFIIYTKVFSSYCNRNKHKKSQSLADMVKQSLYIFNPCTCILEHKEYIYIFWGVNICVVFVFNFHASKQIYPWTLNIKKCEIKQPYICMFKNLHELL